MGIDTIKQYFLANRRIYILDDKEYRKNSLVFMCTLITSIFTLLYISVSYVIDFRMGMVSQALACGLFVSIMFLFKYSKFNISILGYLYAINCFQTIAMLPYYSGGLGGHSLILPWLSIIPAISLLLLDIKAAWIWFFITVLVIVGYALIPIEYTPITYNLEFDKPFSILVYAGLSLIILVVNLVFKHSENRATEELEDANKSIQEHNEEILTQNEEITVQNDEILAQKNSLEESKQIIEAAYSKLESSNSKILASVQYAQRIQQAILPTENYIKSILPNSFVFFRPRDVVSGDFYWIEEYKHKIYFAAIDCTGHGVPGAFMSLIGNSVLNEIIYSGVSDTGEILTKMNQQINKTLNQSDGGNKDGMDMTICCFNPETNELQFSGAKNPLVYINTQGLTKIKGDSCSIGGNVLDKHKTHCFKSHNIKLTEPTMFYLFTDGYQDQFGGEDEFKFTQKRMRTLFETNYELPTAKQLELLDKTFSNWKKDTNQIDDVLVMGVKLG